MAVQQASSATFNRKTFSVFSKLKPAKLVQTLGCSSNQSLPHSKTSLLQSFSPPPPLFVGVGLLALFVLNHVDMEQ